MAEEKRLKPYDEKSAHCLHRPGAISGFNTAANLANWSARARANSNHPDREPPAPASGWQVPPRLASDRFPARTTSAINRRSAKDR